MRRESILSHNVEGEDWRIRNQQNKGTAYSYPIDIILEFSFRFFRDTIFYFTDSWPLSRAWQIFIDQQCYKHGHKPSIGTVHLGCLEMLRLRKRPGWGTLGFPKRFILPHGVIHLIWFCCSLMMSGELEEGTPPIRRNILTFQLIFTKT